MLRPGRHECVADECDDSDERYAAALRSALAEFDEPGLGQAYELGRTALNQRRSLIDLVLLHHTVLHSMLPADPGTDDTRRRQTLTAAGAFLAESLSPYEMAYRGFLETHEAFVSVNLALEREARRVARLLHDGAGQLLFALQLALTELDRKLPPELATELGEIRSLTLQLDDQLHQHSRELYPVVLEDLGLVPALRQLIEGLGKLSSTTVAFTSATRARQAAPIEVTIYRCVQEALTNALKHAQASRIDVKLWQKKATLVCTISDNGVGGIDVEPARKGRKGLGLVSMRERMKLVGGTVGIRSEAGRGTEVALIAPLRQPVGA